MSSSFKYSTQSCLDSGFIRIALCINPLNDVRGEIYIWLRKGLDEIFLLLAEIMFPLFSNSHEAAMIQNPILVGCNWMTLCDQRRDQYFWTNRNDVYHTFQIFCSIALHYLVSWHNQYTAAIVKCPLRISLKHDQREKRHDERWSNRWRRISFVNLSKWCTCSGDGQHKGKEHIWLPPNYSLDFVMSATYRVSSFSFFAKILDSFHTECMSKSQSSLGCVVSIDTPCLFSFSQFHVFHPNAPCHLIPMMTTLTLHFTYLGKQLFPLKVLQFWHHRLEIILNWFCHGVDVRSFLSSMNWLMTNVSLLLRLVLLWLTMQKDGSPR